MVTQGQVVPNRYSVSMLAKYSKQQLKLIRDRIRRPPNRVIKHWEVWFHLTLIKVSLSVVELCRVLEMLDCNLEISVLELINSFEEISEG